MVAWCAKKELFEFGLMMQSDENGCLMRKKSCEVRDFNQLNLITVAAVSQIERVFFVFCFWPVECFFYCLRLHPMNFIVFVRWLFVSNYFCQNIKVLCPHLKWCLSIFYLWCDKFKSSFQLLFFAPFFHCLLLFEEAARVHQCKVRVLALQNEPGVARV